MKRIFHKVYVGPGYPVDPKNEIARAAQRYLNAFAPDRMHRAKQTGRELDSSKLREWLVANAN